MLITGGVTTTTTRRPLARELFVGHGLELSWARRMVGGVGLLSLNSSHITYKSAQRGHGAY